MAADGLPGQAFKVTIDAILGRSVLVGRAQFQVPAAGVWTHAGASGLQRSGRGGHQTRRTRAGSANPAVFQSAWKPLWVAANCRKPPSHT